MPHHHDVAIVEERALCLKLTLNYPHTMHCAQQTGSISPFENITVFVNRKRTQECVYQVKSGFCFVAKQDYACISQQVTTELLRIRRS